MKENNRLRQHVIDRVFDEADAAYVKLASPGHEGLFHSERKRLALMCIGDVRQHAKAIRAAHAREARNSRELHPIAELQIAANFAKLSLLCGALSLWVRVFGPERTQSVAGYIASVSARLQRETAADGLAAR